MTNTRFYWIAAVSLLLNLTVATATDRKSTTRPVEASTKPAEKTDAPNGTVIFHGGYETDPRDHGRPVVLIAAGLDVSSDVFRDAFSGVKPARAGEQPQEDQVRKNKQVLMDKLSPHGVTDDKLNTVSNYYRYNGRHGEMWKNTPVKATAIITNGVVTGFNITDAGAGYSSAPTVTVVGYDDVHATVELKFGTDLKTNGSVKAISIDAPKSDLGK